ncbi:hypothetical protein [Agromyces bracchium]|uniref:Uncharacterized protein n=1 Tax=Agromyces bracchium TaxID=88376 RepID=A0A6I3M3E4_9MICO|nr:hypothetical protein [Agromyces bracchium]MTH67795.1 hypothetical protein [Agromyces bracchium]
MSTDDASSHHPTPPPAGDDHGPGRFEPFAVDRILIDQLPSSLGTVEAPERYSVMAVFTRRPLPQELALLGDPAVERQLADAGYPRVTLTTADRRLVIANTNLHELKVGLARTIGLILEDIGKRVAVTRSAQARDAAELATRAAERASHVLDEATQIDFSPRVSHYT